MRPAARVPPRPPHAAARGFTLIELLIAMVVIAILAAIAYPSYRDHVLRGRLTDGAQALATLRAAMERHYQDHRTYATAMLGTQTVTTPCAVPVAQRTVGAFVLSCDGTPTATAYTLQAQGLGFRLTVDQTDRRATTAAPSGWRTCATAWILSRSQACT